MGANILLERLRSQGVRISGVSWNPLSQAAQFEAEGVDLAVALGLCLGYDILCARAFSGVQTTLVVKDRVHRHRTLGHLETNFT